MRRVLLLLGLGILVPLALVASTLSHAHEIKPAYLELKQASHDVWAVLWKMPIKGGIPAPMEPTLPANCREQGERVSFEVTGARVHRWRLACEGGIDGHPVAIAGLQHSMTDALVRIAGIDRPIQTVRLTPRQNSTIVDAAPGTGTITWSYFTLGVEHILLGIDHLLFVFALLLIVIGWRRLLATITAFTVAHSITLSAASLGLVQVPQAPVEAVIALSILLLAAEIVRAQFGRPGQTHRSPWLVAFGFGLLHGFGFAGALTEIGLPATDIPLALLSFNAGVEVGQLLFVAGVVCLGYLAVGVAQRYRQLARLAAAYSIGSIAMFWTIERISAFYV
ncbi:HupE/UreJ family protein [Microbulbifer agarilyticus]|uniref:HupE/UreJ family protein n=1 Tax=Microbulbifer agarilyticus TaxID=260552 RepID=UPI001CD34057|nr:HupE/UreJ family protein [Microbulbifer agarilyticus]MCA0895013.1 HupE/UreJ family protein [Microbulbifer agarilyticus]